MPRASGAVLVTVAFAAVTGLLSLFVVVGAFVWPPVMVVAGAAEPTRAADVTAPQPPATSTTPPTPTRRQAQSATPWPTPPESPAQAPRPAGTAQPRQSVRLPAGGTAALIRTELEQGGVLPVPDDLDEATWWGAGLTSRAGASVFAGHVNWHGQTGPFAELWRMEIGDRVTVLGGNGKPLAFRVSRVLSLAKDELPAHAEKLFGQDGPHRVVLVTCGGRWVGGSDGYSENLIVIADPV
ncbi:MAG: class F sortase [Pseudonocardiaceae bacterium]